MQPEAPRAFHSFIQRFPELGDAWDSIRRAEANSGPLDEKSRRLVKLALAVGAKQTGAVSSSVRKGLAAGLTLEELEQVVCCAASTIGMPATVAAFGWVREAAEKSKE